jgi:predicted MFS family arabinose efflux permease
VIGGCVLAIAGLRALPWTGAALAALALLLFAVARRARL